MSRHSALRRSSSARSSTSSENIREQGTTVLIVEQNVKQTLAIADRAYVLENGKVVMEGTGQALLNDEHVRTAYLGV